MGGSARGAAAPEGLLRILRASMAPGGPAQAPGGPPYSGRQPLSRADRGIPALCRIYPILVSLRPAAPVGCFMIVTDIPQDSAVYRSQLMKNSTGGAAPA